MHSSTDINVICVSVYVCVLTVFIYLFIYFLNVWVLLPFDGEIKMYIYIMQRQVHSLLQCSPERRTRDLSADSPYSNTLLLLLLRLLLRGVEVTFVNEVMFSSAFVCSFVC